MAGIKAAFQTLEQSAKIPIQKEIYEKINIQVNRLAKTVENLLNYSKPITLEIKSVNIQEIIEKAFFFVHKHITDHQIKVEKQYSKEIPDLNLDAELILQVFVNIFLNAISAMPKGGVLAINTSLLDDFVIISICDTGKGIPSKYVDKIFQPFFTTKPGGTGLGLFTSQNIVKMHNGIIEFTSEEVKKTCFVIKLPVNKN